MKKKSSAFILVLIAFLVFANTGYAKAVSKKITAVFGSYVIKLNGKTQTTETLANGSKVYIPITDLTKLTGAAVKKTGTTYAITPVIREDGVTKKNVDAIKKELAIAESNLTDVKLMALLMDQYKQFEDFNSYLYNLSEYLDYSYYEISESGLTSNLDKTIEQYNELNSVIVKLTNSFKDIEKEAKKLGFDTTEDADIVKEILQKYNGSLTLMDESIDLLKEYAANPSNKVPGDQSYEKYSDALDISYEAEELAYQNYEYYLNEITGK